MLGEHDSSVKDMLDTFGVYLQPSAFRKDIKPLLKEACSRIFGSATGLTDMMVQHFPSSKAGSAMKASACSLTLSLHNVPLSAGLHFIVQENSKSHLGFSL